MGNVVSRDRGGAGRDVKRVIQTTVMIIATIKNCHSRRWSLRVRHSICGKSMTTATTTVTATSAALAMSLFAVVVDVAAVKVAINIIFFANLQLRTCNLQFLPPQVAQLQVARCKLANQVVPQRWLIKPTNCSCSSWFIMTNLFRPRSAHCDSHWFTLIHFDSPRFVSIPFRPRPAVSSPFSWHF